jgi:CRISPR-associated protein Cas2
MALSAIRTWLIAYDIRDERRLRRVHRYLSSVAVPVQYSVFVTRAAAHRVGVFYSRLSELIDSGTDDVRIYHVPDRAEVATLGVQGLPEGIRLLEGGAIPRVVPFTCMKSAAKVDTPIVLGEEVSE